MLFYGIFGLIINIICALISTYVPCDTNLIPELSKTLCDYTDSNQQYYFDNYNIFFNDLYSDSFTIKLIFLIIKSILNYALTYSIYQVFKY